MHATTTSRGYSGLVLEAMRRTLIAHAEQDSANILAVYKDALSIYQAYNWNSGYLVMVQFLVHLRSVLQHEDSDRLHVLACLALCTAGIAYMHFLHEHDQQFELEVFRHAVKHSIHIDEATENALNIPQHSM